MTRSRNARARKQAGAAGHPGAGEAPPAPEHGQQRRGDRGGPHASAPLEHQVDASHTSHYDVLGLDRDCSQAEIKRAYYEAARRWHPDKCSEPGAEERFKRISHAYGVLSNPATRRLFDETGLDNEDDAEPTSMEEMSALFQHMCADMFGGVEAIQAMFQGMSKRQLSRMPPFPLPKECFPPGTFPDGVRFSSSSGAGPGFGGVGGFPFPFDLTGGFAAHDAPWHGQRSGGGRSGGGSGPAPASRGPGGRRRRAPRQSAPAPAWAPADVAEEDAAALEHLEELLAGLSGGYGGGYDDFSGTFNDQPYMVPPFSGYAPYGFGDMGFDDSDDYTTDEDDSEWETGSDSELGGEEEVEPGVGGSGGGTDGRKDGASSTEGLNTGPADDAVTDAVRLAAPSQIPPAATSEGPSLRAATNPASCAPVGAPSCSSAQSSSTAAPAPGLERTQHDQREVTAAKPAPPPPAAQRVVNETVSSVAEQPKVSQPVVVSAAPAPGPAQPRIFAPQLLREWMSAAKAGDVHGLAALLAATPGLLHMRGPGLGHTALHWAAARGHLDTLAFLLHHGAAPAARNAEGSTPLHAAARNGQVKAVSMLLACGPDAADLGALDSDGYTAAQLAAMYGYQDVVDCLSRGGMNWEPEGNMDNVPDDIAVTPVSEGSDAGSGRVASPPPPAPVSREVPAAPEVPPPAAPGRSGTGQDARAARRAALLAEQAEADARDEARERARVEAAVKAGVPPDQGRQWLQAAQGGDVELMRRMLATNPSLLAYQGQGTSLSFSGSTALHWAASKGHAAAVAWLLGLPGVQVDARNNAGSTPLHGAASALQRDCIAVLVLQGGADVQAMDEADETPRDILMRLGPRGGSLLCHLDLVSRLAGLQGAPCSSWSVRSMRGALAAAGRSAAGIHERSELVAAVSELLDKEVAQVQAYSHRTREHVPKPEAPVKVTPPPATQPMPPAPRELVPSSALDESEDDEQAADVCHELDTSAQATGPPKLSASQKRRRKRQEAKKRAADAARVAQPAGGQEANALPPTVAPPQARGPPPKKTGQARTAQGEVRDVRSSLDGEPSGHSSPLHGACGGIGRSTDGGSGVPAARTSQGGGQARAAAGADEDGPRGVDLDRLQRQVEAARTKGNASYSAGDFSKAVSHYTMAIRLCPDDSPAAAVLYSNRAAAYASMSHFAKSLADADEAVRLDPNMVKAHGRRGSALMGMRQFEEAARAFMDALNLDPTYAVAQEGVEAALKATA